MFYIVLSGVLTLTLTTCYVYHVQPDDKLCVQQLCPTLQDIINHNYTYIRSNTTLMFGIGVHHHNKGDLIVQDVTNFSLLGAPSATGTHSTVRCLPEHLIYFYNVTCLLIKNLRFIGCGSLMPEFNGPLYASGATRHYWGAVFMHYCTNVETVNVLIANPVGYGVSGYNVMGNSSFKNVTIMMTRENPYDSLGVFACSYAVHWMYGGNSLESDKNIFFDISNITLKQFFYDYGPCVASPQDFIEIMIYQFRVHVTITNSEFYKLAGNIINFAVASLAYNSIDFQECVFIQNSAAYLVYIQHTISDLDGLTDGCVRLDIRLTDVDFVGNSNFLLHKLPNAVLQYEGWPPNSSLSLVHISFNNILFHGNASPLLKVSSTAPLIGNHSSVIVTITGYFAVHSNKNFNYRFPLIFIANGRMHFNGAARFYGNDCFEIIYLSSAFLYFSNSIVFTGNTCNQLLYLDCIACYLTLSGHANLYITKNKVTNGIIQIATKYNNPYPYCIFQFFSPVNNRVEDFNIKILLQNDEFSKIFEMLRLAVHCKWAPGVAFANRNPLILNSDVIDFNNTYKLGIHTTVCYCPTSSHYNCSVDQLGPSCISWRKLDCGFGSTIQ